MDYNIAQSAYVVIERKIVKLRESKEKNLFMTVLN